jgi:hypothetical protein
VKQVIERYGAIEADFGSSTVKHSVYKRIRYLEIARIAAQLEGDLAEVGARYGLTTALLAMAAEQYGRRVLVVDSWQGHYKKDRREFDKRMRGWESLVDVVHADSQSQEALEALSRPLSLAYLDADHSIEAVKRDLEAVKHARIIIVDGIHDVQGTRLAWRRFAPDYGLTLTLPKLHEGYIITRDGEMPE